METTVLDYNKFIKKYFLEPQVLDPRFSSTEPSKKTRFFNITETSISDSPRSAKKKVFFKESKHLT